MSEGNRGRVPGPGCQRALTATAQGNSGVKEPALLTVPVTMRPHTFVKTQQILHLNLVSLVMCKFTSIKMMSRRERGKEGRVKGKGETEEERGTGNEGRRGWLREEMKRIYFQKARSLR